MALENIKVQSLTIKTTDLLIIPDTSLFGSFNVQQEGSAY